VDKQAETNQAEELRQSVSRKLLGAEVRKIIGKHPNDGKAWDCQCARCGSSLDWESCDHCGGEGGRGWDDLQFEDPFWYDENDFIPCDICEGEGGWWLCLSGEKWCDENPLPGREDVKRSTPEWFCVESA